MLLCDLVVAVALRAGEERASRSRVAAKAIVLFIVRHWFLSNTRLKKNHIISFDYSLRGSYLGTGVLLVKL